MMKNNFGSKDVHVFANVINNRSLCKRRTCFTCRALNKAKLLLYRARTRKSTVPEGEEQNTEPK